MKTCVFIVGTNCSGKTTLAKNLIGKFGGIKTSDNRITRTMDNRCSLAGKYNLESKFGGVDSLCATAPLAGIVEEALRTSDVVICEGSFMNTFGNNLTNAIFKAQKQLVVFLYASAGALKDRMKKRSGTELKEIMMLRQKQVYRAVGKWKSIGVPLMVINTDVMTPEKIADKVYNVINNCINE